MYELVKFYPDGPKRNNRNYEMDVIEATLTGTIINGIKGKCSLSHLKHYNPVSSTSIDYMHSILEGVVKNFFKFWFSTEYKVSEYFSLRNFVSEIDRKLLLIKPPTFLAFILYYAIPVFNNIMPDKLFKNIIKLIIFIETLLSKEVSVVHLKMSQNLVVEFIDELDDLYPKNIMLSGVHELLHFVEGTLDFGPVNITNLFTYEELNRKIIRLIKGKDLIGEEFIKLFSTAQCLSKVEPSSIELKEYLSQTAVLRSSNRKNKGKFENIIKLLGVKMIVSH